MEVKSLTSTPHASSMYESGLLWHNNRCIKSKCHMTCVFLFYFKIFIQSTFIYTINLLKPYLFQSSNDTECLVGLRQPMKSIFKPEDDLNYFDKFMPLFKHKTGFLKINPIFFWKSKKCPGKALILPILRLNLPFKI